MKPEESDIYQPLHDAARLGRQGPHAGHPRQRRPAGSVRAGVRVRRARHRPVPHRAHVLRRGPHREGAADDPRRQRDGPPGGAGRAAAAAARDFYGVFKAMHGEPVTIRTIDPPLHEFLPKREDLMVEIAKLEAKGGNAAELAEKKTLLHRVEQLHEFNPMLGHRGVRLGHHLSRDHRDAGAGHLRGGVPAGEGRPQGHAGDHDSAGRPRQGAARPEGHRRPRGGRGHEGAEDQDQVPRRHDDRGAARGADGGRDRRARRSSSRSARTT